MYVPVIMGSVMARLCTLVKVPIDIEFKTAASTVETVQGRSENDVTDMLHIQQGEHMTLRCSVHVNIQKPNEVMLRQKVFRVAGCDKSLFDDCLYSQPYASIRSYHKALISLPKEDKALTATCLSSLRRLVPRPPDKQATAANNDASPRYPRVSPN